MVARIDITGQKFHGLMVLAHAGRDSTRIIKRDKVCQKCGADKELQVHHLESYAVNHELRICENNGAVLCFRCHLAFHINYGRKTGFTKENYYEFARKTN